MIRQLVLLGVIGVWIARPELREARSLLRKGKAREAAAILEEARAKHPGDPWLQYNHGIAAYAAGDFAKADEAWQGLAATSLPEILRQKVWAQLGNVSFRMAERLEQNDPDAAITRLQQSRQAFRVAQGQSPADKTTLHNLPLVEKHLERFYMELAKRLVAQAAQERHRPSAIGKLRAALTYQQGAMAIAPTNAEHKAAEKRIQQLLAEQFVGEAEDTENEGDRAVSRKNPKDEERQTAQELWQQAGNSFRVAQSYDPARSDAAEGERRVRKKLADLLSARGRREQKTAESFLPREPEQAIEHFEEALPFFERALAIIPDHKDAWIGREEVRRALEKIHLDQGDRAYATGDEQAKDRPAAAVQSFLGALEHFEQAKVLNPKDPSIQERIDGVRARLPDLLVQLGQQDQQGAVEAEPESIPAAIRFLERAGMSFAKALQIEPGNVSAQRGKAEVEAELNRLRQLLAENEPPPERQASAAEQESFREMLEKARAADRNSREMKARRGTSEAQAASLKTW